MRLGLKGGPLDGQTLFTRTDFSNSLDIEHPKQNEVGHYDHLGRWQAVRPLKPQTELPL